MLGRASRAGYSRRLPGTRPRARNAVDALDAQARALLYYHYIDGLSIDQLGPLYGVHRATVACWLAQARERILKDTRRHLTAQLRINTAEAESLLRGVMSQLGSSLPGRLQPPPATP